MANSVDPDQTAFYVEGIKYNMYLNNTPRFFQSMEE